LFSFILSFSLFGTTKEEKEDEMQGRWKRRKNKFWKKMHEMKKK
jgi:hypothetical protein